MRKILVLWSILVVASCQTTSPIEYQPSPMSFSDATDIIDRLTMTQRPEWRPDFFEVNDRYILWGYGTASREKEAIVGRTTATSTREVGDRLYYDSPHSIVLSLWSGDHYLVSIRNEDNNVVTHVFRTSNLENAQRYVDAMETIASYYRDDSL